MFTSAGYSAFVWRSSCFAATVERHFRRGSSSAHGIRCRQLASAGRARVDLGARLGNEPAKAVAQLAVCGVRRVDNLQ